MIVLPASSQALVAQLPIPKDLKGLPDHLLIRAIVLLTSKYRELVPDLSDARLWARFKAFTAEFCQALKITDYYTHLYESPEHSIQLLFQFSLIEEFQREMKECAIEAGYGDLVGQKVDDADPERLRAFSKIAFQKLGQAVTQELDELDEFDDWDQMEAEGKNYWQNVHPTLSTDEQRKAERDVQLFACLFLYILHNSISVMAYGELLSSLVQRALAGGPDAYIAMCKAVRVDNSFRQHPQFMARYLSASQKSESDFLRRYNNASPPLTNKIRYPGLYFLLALLDGFGLLDRLTNPQLLDLCDHARLDKWENRVEDAGYLAKRRNEYQRHKFIQQSTHSN